MHRSGVDCLSRIISGAIGVRERRQETGPIEQERATECLLEQAYHDKAMNARKKSVNMSPEADSLGRHWLEHRAKCQIANRDYNRLMR